MENNVASFSIDHDRLLRGVYVSRKDAVGAETVTTFDLRIKKPNVEPVLGNPEIHTLEHLLAVYLRSSANSGAGDVVYIGPMGCRTGFYLIVKGDKESRDVLDMVTAAFRFAADFEGGVPATASRECGNCLDHNLVTAKWEAKKYLGEVLSVIKPENLTYPE